MNNTILNSKEPTLASVEAEIKANEEKAAAIKAQREEEWRVTQKKNLLCELATLRSDAKEELKAIKKRKKTLKEILCDLEKASDEEDLTAEDIQILIGDIRTDLRGALAEGGTVMNVGGLTMRFSDPEDPRVFGSIMNNAIMSDIVMGCCDGSSC